MHEGVGVRVAVEALGMGNGDAAEDKGASGDQLMYIVTNSYMNHVAECRGARGKLKEQSSKLQESSKLKGRAKAQAQIRWGGGAGAVRRSDGEAA
ncbi:hypothetical protein LBMAG56_13000 [Verrucomicrobiota bacterium]|nr:hypothetical protein LBMAG56_13000 [Verrucomicrobiota bacterium]